MNNAELNYDVFSLPSGIKKLINKVYSGALAVSRTTSATRFGSFWVKIHLLAERNESLNSQIFFIPSSVSVAHKVGFRTIYFKFIIYLTYC